jgi:hypothetical protein
MKFHRPLVLEKDIPVIGLSRPLSLIGKAAQLSFGLAGNYYF